jgi:hypothetical protein
MGKHSSQCFRDNNFVQFPDTFELRNAVRNDDEERLLKSGIEHDCSIFACL